MGIGNEEPIHVTSSHNELTRLRTSHANKKIQLILAPRVIDQNNKYEQERTKFDQLRPILASASSSEQHPPFIPLSTTTYSSNEPSSILITNSSNTTSSDDIIFPDSDMNSNDLHIPTISVLVHTPLKPVITSNIQDCFATNSPHRSFWLQTVYEKYDKNASYRVFTQPLPKHAIPLQTIILWSILAPTVKELILNPSGN